MTPVERTEIPADMPAPKDVVELFDRFRRNYYAYKAPTYNETQLRREFIDPLFEALGWDVNNRQGYAEAYKDVVHEDSLKIDGSSRSPDYSFRVGGVRKFFVETKKPSVNLKDDPSPAFQLRRYGWSANLPVSILTDFEEFVVYDTRVRPKAGDKASTARIEYLRGDEIIENWDERIASRFSRDAVLRGDFDRFAGEGAKRRGSEPVDNAFLAQIEQWRDSLARVLALRNPELSVSDLNFAVQVTIDRLVFLRIAEDRGLEEDRRLLTTVQKKDAYAELLRVFKLADDRYNSGLFHFRGEKGRSKADNLTPTLKVDDKTLREMVEGLYYPASAYEFSVLPADILGQVYERFLGQVIRLTPAHRAVVEARPEVRKAGGVFYTPTYVVRHIVRAAVLSQLEGRTPKQIVGFRVLDPSCGSGSFLLEVYQSLLDWYEAWYIKDGPKRWSESRNPTLRPSSHGWKLTTTERKRILLAHVFGVDIDSQAVEVTKLSLLLKVLEGETNQSIAQLNLLHDRALPDLDRNIKCGNSLIASDFLADAQGELLDESESHAANVFDWSAEFAEVMADGGFDAVVGNPPYVLLQDEFRNDAHLSYFKSKYRVAAFKIDTYHLFIERALRLTKKGGLVSMITPSNFLTNNHLAELRRMLLEDTAIEEMTVVDGGVFRGVSVDNAIFVLRSGHKGAKEFRIQHAQPAVDALVVGKVETVSTSIAKSDPHALFVGTAGKQVATLWRKVEAKSTPLGDVAFVNFGKQLRDRKKFTKDVIEVESVQSVPRSYRPCYTGRDVRRYSVEWSGLACLNREEARSGGCWDGDKQDAPNKLLTKQIGKVPEFGIDEHGYQCLNTMFMVNVKDDTVDPLLLLAQLNSSVCHAIWLDRYYDRRKTFPKIKGTYLKQLPVLIPNLKDPEQNSAAKKIVELVRRVTRLRASHGKANATDDGRIARQIEPLERSIDEEIFRLYGFSSAEVKAIEEIVAAGRV